MTPAENLHALIPVFNWSWWQIFLVTLVADWGIIHLLKWLDPPHRKTPHWWTNVYGDIFLPIGIASSAVVIRDLPDSNAWYVSRTWNWIVVVAAIISIIFIEFVIVFKVKNVKTIHQATSVSNIWHAIAFIPMFYLSVMTLAPLFVTRTPTWAFVLALVGYTGWFLTLIHDNIWPPENKPVSFWQWLKSVL
jgi:magnesium-transporting ATPase (P-type)